MLLRCIKSENSKLKYSYIWLAFFIIPILPAAIGTFNYLGNIEILTNGWYSLWTQHTLFYADFFHGPLIAAYCSYLWRLEHLNGNWNRIMTVPVRRSCIFISKFASVFGMAFLTQLWVGLLFYLSDRLAGLKRPMPSEIIVWLLLGGIGSIAVIGLQLLLSMVIRSFSIPVIIALLGQIAGIYLSSSGRGLCYPYSVLSIGMNSNAMHGLSGASLLAYLTAVCLHAVLFSGIAILLLRVRDVRK